MPVISIRIGVVNLAGRPAALLFCLLFSTLVGAMLAANASATTYDHIGVSTATDYKIYQNLGRIGPDASSINITNISEYSQTLLITSNVNGSFQYPGQKSLSVFYVLNPFELNEVANALQPSANTVRSSVNMPPSQAWSLINVSLDIVGNTVSSAYPLRIYVSGYTNTSKSYGGFAPYKSTYSNVITSDSGTLLIPELYNVTAIYFNRPIIGSVNVSVWDVSYNNPSNAVKLAYLNSIPDSLILYGPVSSYQNYYLTDPGNVPVRYDNSGYSSVNFTLTKTYNSNLQNASGPQQFYAYSIGTLVSNTLPPATFSFGIVNASVGTWGGVAPLDINYTASSSNAVGMGNHITYTSPGGAIANVQAGFLDPAGSNFTGISPQGLTFDLAQINESYVMPQLATLSASPTSSAASSHIMLNATVEYGKAPYSYDYRVFNAANNSLVANMVKTSQSNSNTFVWTPASHGTFYANVIITDADSNSAYSPHTANIIITDYVPMSIPSISATPNVLAVGHSIIFNASVTGGAAPYSYEFFVYNSSSGGIAARKQYSDIYQGAETFAWNANSSGTFYANVIITDSSSNTVASPRTGDILVENLTAPTLALSSTVLDAGQEENFTAQESGGTPPYSYNFTVVSSLLSKEMLTNLTVVSASPEYTFTWKVPASYPHTPAIAKVTVTDKLGATVNSTETPGAGVINTINVTGGAGSLSVPPSGNMLYVTESSGTVDEINTTTGMAVNSFSLGISSTLVFNHSGSTAYGTSYYGGQVSVINVSTWSVTKTIRVGAYPSGMALNPSGTMLYITNKGSGTVSVINTTTATVVKNLTGFSYPIGIAISPSGSTLYVANSNNGGAGTVSIVNISTGSLLDTVPVGYNPMGITLNPSGTLLYVANYGSSTVSVIDTATDAVTATISGIYSPWGATFNPAGTFAYIYDPGSGVYVVDTATSSVVDTFAVTKASFSMSNLVFNQKGTVAYVSDGASSAVRVVSPLPYVVIEAEPSISISLSTASSSIGQRIRITNTTTGGTPPYAFRYGVFQNGVPASTSNYTLDGNNVSFNAGGRYEVIEELTDNYGVTAYSQNSVITVSKQSNSTVSSGSGTSPGGSQGGSSGSSVGGGGGPSTGPSSSPGSFSNKLTVTYTSDGYFVYGITAGSNFTVELCNRTMRISDAYIESTFTEVTINGTEFALFPYEATPIPDTGASCYAEPTHIYYTANSKSAVSMLLFSNSESYRNITNSSSPIDVSFSSSLPELLYYNLMDAKLQINSYSKNITTMRLRMENVTLQTPPPPQGYAKIEALNITSNSTSFSSINVSVGYSCPVKNAEIVPFILGNGTWNAINNFTDDNSSCSVSFFISSDPVVGIFQRLTYVSTVTTTIASTIPTTIPEPPPNATPRQSPEVIAAFEYLLVIAIAVFFVAIAVLEFMKKRGKQKEKESEVSKQTPEQMKPPDGSIT